MNEITINDSYVSLGLKLNNLPERIKVNNIELVRKSSFHVSLFCVKNITNDFGEDISQKIVTFFREYTKDNPITFHGLKDEFRFAIDKTRERKSLIVMVEINNLGDFFENVRKHFQIDIDNQPTHITLYTLIKDEGIGINNQNDLLKLTEVVTSQIPEEIKNRLSF